MIMKIKIRALAVLACLLSFAATSHAYAEQTSTPVSLYLVPDVGADQGVPMRTLTVVEEISGGYSLTFDDGSVFSYPWNSDLTPAQIAAVYGELVTVLEDPTQREDFESDLVTENLLTLEDLFTNAGVNLVDVEIDSDAIRFVMDLAKSGRYTVYELPFVIDMDIMFDMSVYEQLDEQQTLASMVDCCPLLDLLVYVGSFFQEDEPELPYPRPDWEEYQDKDYDECYPPTPHYSRYFMMNASFNEFLATQWVFFQLEQSGAMTELTTYMQTQHDLGLALDSQVLEGIIDNHFQADNVWYNGYNMSVTDLHVAP